ncbi:MAG: glycoside hydrolase family 3 N-terminal domain-containing protein [Candidatus Paceibacterota bacterium]
MSLKHFIVYISGFAVMIFIISLGFSYQQDKFSSLPSRYTASIKTVVATSAQKSDSSLSLEQKVQQLFLWGFDGTTPLQAEQFIEKYPLGGVMFLEKNIESIPQVQSLTHQLQVSSLQKSGLPLFISIDQEGGVVSRITFPGYEFTPQSEITSLQQAYTVAKKRGEELHTLGINLNFSPVLDAITNTQSFLYSRTFIGTPQEISERGTLFVKGYRDAGIQSCPKHFPGHGDALNDPHLFNSINNQSVEEIQKNAKSFVGVISENAACIMLGHTTYRNIDINPASKSSAIITNWLRNSFHFNGIILTDDMEMVAAQNKQTLGEAALSSLQAGADMVLISGYTTSREEREFAIAYVIEKITEGAIPSAELDEKINRILEIKKGL